MLDISKLKVILLIEDNTEDQLLQILKEHSIWKIKAYVKITEEQNLPQSLEWIADELTAKRYNKVAAEGLKTEGINGVSQQYEEDFLAEFREVLDAYILQNTVSTGKRLVMF